ncbi:Sel1 repeat-containing protein [Paraburkholderia fungorum]|uniref:Sel1 repeat-containing protein n=1 Tax=Paraburkholderia fungorum TaxID=134537 RepID=A0A1H1K018_9BURK|nr:caspase family protein [Paraburkholderia fungorum]SDR55215.1 Sel1 repeat-containing protein [Paraburkholderia fungorum]
MLRWTYLSKLIVGVVATMACTLYVTAFATAGTLASAPETGSAVTKTTHAAKVALVIGNSAYSGGDRLVSPANDARLIGETLRGLGFDTRVDYDLSQDEFNGSIDWLATHARGAQVVVFYYAGHGFESAGDNFLVPVHAGVAINAMTRSLLLERAIRLKGALAKVRASQPTSFIALIDACRVPSRGATTSTLKREPAARGELIAYSTATQAAAYDSMRTFGTQTDDGPFAYYLAMYMKAPNATIKGALEHTQQQVADITGGQQQPWIESGLIGDVMLAQNLTGTPPPPVYAQVAPPNGPTRGVAAAGTPPWPTPSNLATVTVPVVPAPGAPVNPANANNSLNLQPLRNDPGTRQRAESWDDAEMRITTAAHQSSRSDLQNLRSRPHDPVALTTLGMMSEEGLGVPRNPRAAMSYYRRGAEANYPIAQTLLGEAYFEGKLVPRDLDQAEKWLARAAAQDFSRARLDLAQLRAERGQGNTMQNWADAMNLMIDSIRPRKPYPGSTPGQ